MIVRVSVYVSVGCQVDVIVRVSVYVTVGYQVNVLVCF